MNGRGSRQAIGAALTFAEATDLGVLDNTRLEVVAVDAMAAGYGAWAQLHNSSTPVLVAPEPEPSTLPAEIVAEGLVLGFREVTS